jgi:hypothetical protein
VKIRLMGTSAECAEAAERLATVFRVVDVSEDRANRGRSELVRVYVEIRLETPQAGPEAPGSG